MVIDTSVIIAAFNSPEGGSRAVLRLCLKGECQPLVGVKLLAEYEDVLGRTKPFRRSPLSTQERSDVFDAFLKVSEWVQVFFLWRPNLPDEGDNHLIELAVAGNASALITHNVRDFRRGELRFPGLGIASPAEFLRRWRQNHGNDDHSNS